MEFEAASTLDNMHADGNGFKPVEFSLPRPVPGIQYMPIKKLITIHGFNFVTKPMPIGLVGTHGSSIGSIVYYSNFLS